MWDRNDYAPVLWGCLELGFVKFLLRCRTEVIHLLDPIIDVLIPTNFCLHVFSLVGVELMVLTTISL